MIFSKVTKYFKYEHENTGDNRLKSYSLGYKGKLLGGRDGQVARERMDCDRLAKAGGSHS